VHYSTITTLVHTSNLVLARKVANGASSHSIESGFKHSEGDCHVMASDYPKACSSGDMGAVKGPPGNLSGKSAEFSGCSSLMSGAI
jgi:hypothetical protein